MQEVNWLRIRNGIKKRLRYSVEPQDLPDAIQDACGFAHLMIADGTDPGLAVWKAVNRVKRGHTLCYEPRHAERWEDADYAGTQWYLRNRPGVSEASVEMTRPAGERILPIQRLRKGCHHR